MEQSAADPSSLQGAARPGRRSHRRRTGTLFLALFSALAPATAASGRDTLDEVRATGTLSYGCDMEGGGPFAYLDPDDPSRVVGFEVELMEAIGDRLGIEAELSQGQWDPAVNVLAAGKVDTVVNGYELTPTRARDYRATRPYYVFQLQLMVREGASIRSWDDLRGPKPGGGNWRVGVLGGSSAETFAEREQDGTVAVRSYTGATDAMMQVLSGQLDATLQDLPAARFYAPQFPGIAQVGPPEGHGYYVIYVRAEDEALAEALNRGIDALIADGTLRRIYEKYDIWTDAQEDLDTLDPAALSDEVAALSREARRGWGLIRKYRDHLLRAAGTTVVLSIGAMPIAIVIGLLVALGRLLRPVRC